MEFKIPSRMSCFFLLANEPCVGSCLEMEITLPQAIAGPSTVKVLLQGKIVEIDRESANGRFGVNCVVEKYRLVPED